MIAFFFFQAEDGIRDSSVTGVQTCALPISTRACRSPPRFARYARVVLPGRPGSARGPLARPHRHARHRDDPRGAPGPCAALRGGKGAPAMRLRTVRTLTLTMVGVATMVAIASAQVPIRVRGAIAKVSGQTLTIASRDNSSVEVRLADTVGVTAVVTAALSDIKTGAFVGAAALPQPDGIFRAPQVLIFPESGRGTGEGPYPWDLSPGRTLTTAPA